MTPNTLRQEPQQHLNHTRVCVCVFTFAGCSVVAGPQEGAVFVLLVVEVECEKPGFRGRMSSRAGGIESFYTGPPGGDPAVLQPPVWTVFNSSSLSSRFCTD